MISRFREVLAERRNRLSGVPSNVSEQSSSTNFVNNNEQPTIEGNANNAEAKTEFEPVEKQRHFGILHYTMTQRFRRMMIIGLVNVILIIVFFLFIFFFLELHKDNTNTPVTSTTRKPPTTSNTGYCNSSYKKKNNKCWRFETNGVDHIKGERGCTEKGAIFITVHNQEENQLMEEFVAGTSATHIWMGITCSGNNITNCILDDATQLTFDNFASGHPDVSKGTCVAYLVSDGKWYSSDCFKPYAHICELTMIYHSSGGCNTIMNDNCYFVVGDPSPVVEAVKTCQQTCAQLVSIHSVDENQFVQTMMTYLNNQFYTIGGYAKSKTDVIWLDGSPMDFNALEKFNGEGCIFMSYSSSDLAPRGNWFTASCTTNATFVCKRPLGATCEKGTPMPITLPPPAPTCNSFIAGSGKFTSPNYPNPYPAFTNCTYTLTTFGPQRISLNFDSVSIDTDIIYIYDGDSTQGNALGSLTGTHASAFNAEGNVMFVIFQTGDNKGRNSGFSASFITIY